jgi:hypothetical protein
MKEGSALMPYMPLAHTARGILDKLDLKMHRKTTSALTSSACVIHVIMPSMLKVYFNSNTLTPQLVYIPMLVLTAIG